MMKKIMIVASVMLATGMIGHAASAATYAGVHVRIEAPDTTVYDNTVYISDDGCTALEEELSGLNALCALEAAAQDGGFEYSGAYSDYGFFLDAVDGITNAIDFSEYWGTYLNLRSMTSSLDATAVADGDEVLLTFGGYSTISPLRLTLNKNHVLAGRTVTATVEYFMVTDWMTNAGLYVALPDATVIVGDQTYTTDDSGVVEFSVTDAGNYIVQTTADGYTRSIEEDLIVYPEYSLLYSTTDITSVDERVNDAVEYLNNNRDGGIVGGSVATTEWAVQALAAVRTEYGADAVSDELYNPLVSTVLAYHPRASDGASEIARHILTLEAIGYDARNTNGINYVKRLKKTIANKQFGEENLCNDDIFAGLALIAADEPMDSRALRRAMRASLKCQNDDGGFGYSVSVESETDTTAAWMMLSAHFKGHGSEHRLDLRVPRAAAFAFMKHAQHPDGGWGYNTVAASNSSSTAWSVMGYAAYDIAPSQRMKNNYSGIDFMNGLQGRKGGMQYNAHKDYSIVALNTAYAIMAWLDDTFTE